MNYFNSGRTNNCMFSFLPIFLLCIYFGSEPKPIPCAVVGMADVTCTQSAQQLVYTSKKSIPFTTYKAPMVSGKSVYLYTIDENGDSIQTQFSSKDISLILDNQADAPALIAFSKKGKPYCSTEMGLLDFPDHFSYRCLTKDRKVITAGVLKSQPVEESSSIRKLVNDNINNEDLDVLLKDNIVVECYKASNWQGAVYTINVYVSPSEAEYYKNEIIAMLKQDYAKMDNTTQLEEVIADADEAGDEDAVSTGRDMDPQAETVADLDTNTKIRITSEAESDSDAALDPDSDTESDALAEAPRNLGTRTIPPKLDNILSEADKIAIQKEAEDKLFRLQDCFVTLVNRNYTAAQKQRQRETTVQDLFINERANVGVSSVNSDAISNYLIGDYLLRLERMITGAYQKVEIVFSEIYKVSNFKPNPDGTWSATVTFSQQFRGFNDIDGRELSYSDITQKNVTVRIRRVELFTGDSNPEIYWEVLLADIGVNQTEAF